MINKLGEKMKTIIVTGGAGFIGSYFIKYIIDNYDSYKVINYDLLTYAGNLSNLKAVENSLRYRFIQGNIDDEEKLTKLFKESDVDIVVNFAAESHVDRSIVSPNSFIKTNVLGTQVLLEVFKKHSDSRSLLNPNSVEDPPKFVQVSTDEVYGSLGKKGKFLETTNLSPNSPYAASKASADLIANSYYKTYGLNINITRCSNNYGPNQFPEKLIPLMIMLAKSDKKLPIYGTGKQIRDWIHVHDHCSAIDLVIHKARSGEIFNIGSNNELQNIDLVKKILRYIGKSENLIQFVSDRLGHDFRYAVDSSKIRNELGWYPIVSFEEGLTQTIETYLK